MSTRQSIGFPTVATIRKGTPKIKSGDREIMGKDLNNKFRFEFLPGTDLARQDGQPSIRAAWHALHEKEFVQYPPNFVTREGYELDVIHAMIPAATVWAGWKWQNVTFNAAGMKVAEADGHRYITKRDPLTMEYIVRDGEPFTEFHPKDVITYERGGRTYNLPMKSSGTLDLFLPELMEFVCFKLVTNSYVDSLLIEKNLASIQELANVINKGVAGGIPLDVYRVQMDNPYFDPKDQQAHKSKKWFIQIKANSAWAQAAIMRMNTFALTGEAVAGLLQPIIPNIPQDLPESAFVESDNDEPETVTAESVVDVDDSAVTELIIESAMPAPQRKPNEVITQAAWDTLLRYVDQAKKLQIVTRSYDRSKMTASTVNGASIYLQQEIAKAKE